MSLTQFFQMFYEAHAGKFGAGEGGAGTLDEIIHESEPRSKHHVTSGSPPVPRLVGGGR
jgi:hypothetical protein